MIAAKTRWAPVRSWCPHPRTSSCINAHAMHADCARNAVRPGIPCDSGVRGMPWFRPYKQEVTASIPVLSIFSKVLVTGDFDRS